MYKKISLLLVGFLMAVRVIAAGYESSPVPPREGMWLPHLVKTLNIDAMKELGFKLSAEDIYSVNKSCIKDAVVQLGGFCTAEVVSSKGLLFTNHHCGYDAIATHSTPEHDYLTDGFWAMNQGDEIHTPGLTVKFLQRIEDVTKEVLDAGAAAGEEMRDAAIGEKIGEIEAKASNDGAYTAQVRPIFNGNEYLLFVYEIFRDVRLVGAPPSAVGKFGGDTDNWMWPRHTGDFSILRVYAGPDNKPADYSESNVPYTPKHFLPISLKGFQTGDFAMTLGYPGSTDRYLTSDAISQIYDNNNPEVIKLLGERLKIMKAEMDKDDETRINMASSYASLANYYKYCIGQNRGLRQRGLVEERQAYEMKFVEWVNSDSKRREKYGDVVDQMAKNIESFKPILKLRNYVNMAGFGPGVVNYGVGYWRLRGMFEKEAGDEAISGQVERMKGAVDGHFAEYYTMLDQNLLAATARRMYNDLPEDLRPDVFSTKGFTKAKAKGDMDRFDAYAAKVFSTSILTNKARNEAFLAKPSFKVLQKDLGVQYAASMVTLFLSKLQMDMGMYNAVDGESMRLYQAGMLEMEKNRRFYPDANSTMRLSYGTVLPYDPKDGVSYKTQTYAEGILEKEVPGDEEFNVPAGLTDLIRKGDFGRYGENGKLPVCFLTDNDITGGNSGSPVINGNGELIGIAFDGNWESMTSDLVWDDKIVRTISVDIRYVLFIMDKYAGASRLINELKIVN